MFLIMYLMIISEHYPWCLGAEWGFSTFVEGGARVISSELRFRHKSLVGTRSLVLGSEVYQNLHRTVLNMRTPSLRIRRELSAIECTLSKSFNVTQYVSTSFDSLVDGKHVTTGPCAKRRLLGLRLRLPRSMSTLAIRTTCEGTALSVTCWRVPNWLILTYHQPIISLSLAVTCWCLHFRSPWFRPPPRPVSEIRHLCLVPKAARPDSRGSSLRWKSMSKGNKVKNDDQRIIWNICVYDIDLNWR